MRRGRSVQYSNEKRENTENPLSSLFYSTVNQRGQTD
jgi:hypothetical protein